MTSEPFKKRCKKHAVFATSIFSCFGLDFGSSWASKSAALLAAQGVLNKPYCILCLHSHIAFPCLGGPRIVQKPGGHVGAMLALCWHIFRSWAHFFRTRPLLERFLDFFLLMLIVFFRFGAAQDSILGGLGQMLEPSKPHFSMFCGVSQHTSQQCSWCNKTAVFAMFCRLWNVSHTQLSNMFFA